MITCQRCRALLEVGTAVCPYCSTDQRHHAAPTESEDAEGTGRFGIWILGINVAVYMLTIILDPARADGSGFQPSHDALLRFGGQEVHLVIEAGEWWRLLTAIFLHGDLVHLGLNAVALLYLMPIAAGTFGVHRTVVLYFVAGICGSVVSVGTSDPGVVSVGASGAICGLIGACAAYGKRRGGAVGSSLTRRMLTWAAVIGVYGMVRSGIDNAAHLGGFIGGAGLGWLAAAVHARGGRADRLWAYGARAVVVMAVLVALIFWAPNVLRAGSSQTLGEQGAEKKSAVAPSRSTASNGPSWPDTSWTSTPRSGFASAPTAKRSSSSPAPPSTRSVRAWCTSRS